VSNLFLSFGIIGITVEKLLCTAIYPCVYLLIVYYYELRVHGGEIKAVLFVEGKLYNMSRRASVFLAITVGI